MSNRAASGDQMDFTGQVAIITGAANGLGREYALALAARGAKVVVNGRADKGAAAPSNPKPVVDAICAAGGQAIAICADVTDDIAVEAMVSQANEVFGGVHILINNAGELRDKSFAKMTALDFRTVLDVNVMGAFNCCKAVWPIMQRQDYGRIVMTSSSSGLNGNFGQTNYAAAKLAVVGLMNSLHLEGVKHNIRVNAISPLGKTRINKALAPKRLLDMMPASAVVPAALFLAGPSAPSKAILVAGAGVYALAQMMQTEGVYLENDFRTPEEIARVFRDIGHQSKSKNFAKGGHQDMHLLSKAAAALGVSLD